jgi:transposase-like protein
VASPLLGKLKKAVPAKKPKTLITDGAANFHEAYLKEFWTSKLDSRTEHIRHIRLAGDRNNNRMERFNGELRQREKVMRSLKKPDSGILSGFQIYHNYIRPHKALGYKTPAEVAGIQVRGKDKVLTIIQNEVANSQLMSVYPTSFGERCTSRPSSQGAAN